MDYRPPRPDQPYAWDDERLSAYLDGELSAPEQAQLEARLVVDPELRQLVDELRAVRQQLEVLPEYRLKPSFADQVLRRAEEEMLLPPRADERAEQVEMTAAPAAAVEFAVVTPARHISLAPSTARRWQRGAIWTAIAAAAVLLLIVTNRPNPPQQNHLARHDLPDAGLPQPAAANDQAVPANADKTLRDQHDIAAKQREQEELAKSGEREDQRVPFGQATPSVSIAVGGTGDANVAAAPQQDLAASKKSDANQSARNPADDKSAANRQADFAKNQNAGASGKPLLKNQTPAQRNGTAEKKAAAPREQLSAELAALLTSEEFSRLATEGGAHAQNNTEEQVLVVYMTPRDASRGESSFSALLAKNSIELADKALIPKNTTRLQKSFALSTLEGQDSQPMAKAAAQAEPEAAAKNRKRMEPRDLGKAGQPSHGPVARNETAPAPTSDAIAESSQTPAANELYYLEADASQVDELLRQLRSPSAQFSRLSIVPRPLHDAENRPQVQDEKSLAANPAAAFPQAARAFRDDLQTEGKPPVGTERFGTKQRGDLTQLAQGAAPTPPTNPTAPAAVVPTPASAPAASAAEPFAPPAPVIPNEISTAAAPAGLPTDAPAATDEVTMRRDIKGGFGPDNNAASSGLADSGTDNNGIGNRRTANKNKDSQRGSTDRVIAYRLRGVEALLPPQLAEPAAEESSGSMDLSGGGMAQPAIEEADKQNASAKLGASTKRDKGANASESAKRSAALRPQKSESTEQKADTATAETKSADAMSAAQPTAKAPLKAVPSYSAQENKEMQPRPQAESSDAREQTPLANESQQRQMQQRNAQANTIESTPAQDSVPKEAAKPSSPAPTAMRVRVLFVIEHETSRE